TVAADIEQRPVYGATAVGRPRKPVVAIERIFVGDPIAGDIAEVKTLICANKIRVESAVQIYVLSADESYIPIGRGIAFIDPVAMTITIEVRRQPIGHAIAIGIEHIEIVRAIVIQIEALPVGLSISVDVH